MNIGEYAKWYRPAEPGEIDDAYGEDVQEVLSSYGLDYVGWVVAKDEYFDAFMDNNLEYCLIAQEPDTNNIGIYQWVGDRLYDPKDEIERIIDDYMDEELFNNISIHEALKEAFNISTLDEHLEEDFWNPGIEFRDFVKLYEGRRIERTKNIYTILDAMNWSKPTFIDACASGYRLKWGGHNFLYNNTEEEAQKLINEIKNRTGIECHLNRGGFLVVPYYSSND